MPTRTSRFEFMKENGGIGGQIARKRERERRREIAVDARVDDVGITYPRGEGVGQSDTSHFQFISSAFSWRRKEGCRATFATPSPPLLPPLAQRDTSIPYHRLSILHRNRSRTRIRHDDIKLLEFIYVVDSRASLRVSLPPLPPDVPPIDTIREWAIVVVLAFEFSWTFFLYSPNVFNDRCETLYILWKSKYYAPKLYRELNCRFFIYDSTSSTPISLSLLFKTEN